MAQFIEKIFSIPTCQVKRGVFTLIQKGRKRKGKDLSVSIHCYHDGRVARNSHSFVNMIIVRVSRRSHVHSVASHLWCSASIVGRERGA